MAGERRKGYVREPIDALLDCAWATGHTTHLRRLREPATAPSLALIRAPSTER